MKTVRSTNTKKPRSNHFYHINKRITLRKIRKKVIIYILFSVFLLSTVSGAISPITKSTEQLNDANITRDYTHTVFVEFATMSDCNPCKTAHAALKNIYAGGWHSFYYVTLQKSKNIHAYERVIEYNVTGYPTVFFNGGYKVTKSAASVKAAQAAYNASIGACGYKDVSDIDVNLSVE